MSHIDLILRYGKKTMVLITNKGKSKPALNQYIVTDFSFLN